MAYGMWDYLKGYTPEDPNEPVVFVRKKFYPAYEVDYTGTKMTYSPSTGFKWRNISSSIGIITYSVDNMIYRHYPKNYDLSPSRLITFEDGSYFQSEFEVDGQYIEHYLVYRRANDGLLQRQEVQGMRTAGTSTYGSYFAIAPVLAYNLPEDRGWQYSAVMGFVVANCSDRNYTSLEMFKNVNETSFTAVDKPIQDNVGDIRTSVYIAFSTNIPVWGGIKQDGEFEGGNGSSIYDGNPLFGGGNSIGGGGEGDFNNDSDDIDYPDTPTRSSLNSGFISIYSPSTEQINDLATFLWSSGFTDIIQKFLSSPLDVILGLHIVPVFPHMSANKQVKVGGIQATEVTMPEVTSQYVDVDCGGIEITEFWGSALDYAPYTKIQIYLPYIGTRTLSTDDVMKKPLRVLYRVDVLTGSLVAFIKTGTTVLYTFSGNCSSSIPVTGRDFSQIIQSAISTAVSVGATVATGGASAPITASQALSGVMTTAVNVVNSKPQIQKSGGLGGTCGLLSEQIPYLIIERPRQSLPVDYMKFVGYPSNITSVLSALKGYTEVESVHLEGVTATDNEKTEILKLLQEGVIL